ncbi:MAG: CbiQ family ECF transporter T component, partial [Cyanobacteria bacterium P01_H01_bin.121]
MDLLRALPIGLYLETPITWMHRLDPRIRLCWLMGFLLTPLLASSLWRLALVGLLIILTWLARIPVRVWQQQMSWLIALACLIFVLTAIAPDGLPGNHQPRRPAQPFLELAPPPAAPAPRSSPLNPLSWFQPAPPAVTTPALPQPTGYQYLLVQQGPVTVTRRSFDLGIRVSTLIFTLIYSTNLYLLTTSPEEITAGLEDILSPLRSFGWPITEIALTLTLALRFIPLVLEEIQNLVRSIWTRAINWKQLGLKRGAAIW